MPPRARHSPFRALSRSSPSRATLRVPRAPAPRIPRMPHRTALRAIRRPTHHPAPPVTAPRAKADDPAPPLPAQRRHIRTSRTNVSRETFRPQILSARHPQSRSAPVPRIRHERNPPEWCEGRCDQLPQRPSRDVPLCNSPAPEGAKRRRLEPVLRDIRSADRSAPHPQPPARERRGSQADDEPRAEPSQSEPYQTESSRTASGRIRPGRPNRSEPERFDRAEANRIRPNRTRASRTESDRSGPYRGRAGPIKPYWPNQSEPSRIEPRQIESGRIEPERAGSGWAGSNRTHPQRLRLPDQVALKTTGQTHGTSVRARTMEHDRPQAILLHQMVEHVFERPSCRPKRRESSSEVYALPPSSDARTPTTMQTAFLAFVHSLPAAAHGIAQASTANGRDWRRRRSCKPRKCASCPCRAPNGPRASPHRRIV